MNPASPLAVVQAQLDAYNAKDLDARLLTRSVMGNFVTDLEIVTRNFPEGLGTVEMLCVYEVVDGRIARASFATGEKRMS